MNTRVEIGPHTLEYEEDTGILKMTQVGVLEETHAEQIGEFFARFTTGRNANFVLADNTRATGITAEARKAFGRNRDKVGAGLTTYIAIIGASFAFRAIANLVMTAIRLAGQKLIGTTEVDESTARAWLLEKKRAFEANS